MRTILIVFSFFFLAGCATQKSEPLLLKYEFRTPAIQTNDPLTKFDLFTDRSATGTRLRFTKQRTGGDYTIYSYDCLIFPAEKRRAMVVSWNREGSTSHVFVIPEIKPFFSTDWSQWKTPDYLGGEGSGWAFMHGSKPGSPIMKSPDVFELRYRVSERNEN
jgi:hypothetical protein